MNTCIHWYPAVTVLCNWDRRRNVRGASWGRRKVWR